MKKNKMSLNQVCDLIREDVYKRVCSNETRSRRLAAIAGWEETSIRLMLALDLWRDEEEDVLEEPELPVEYSAEPLYYDDETSDHSTYEREDGDPIPLNFHDDRKW